MTRKTAMAGILLSMLICASVALAEAPFGPPIAHLKEGQFGLAAEYSLGAAEFRINRMRFDTELNNAKSNAIIAQPAYGISDDWEVYANLGAADLKLDKFDDGFGLAYGFGTKVTIEKTDKFAWGFLFEIGWRDNKDDGPMDINGVTYTSTEFDYHDITLAVGPSLEIADGLHLYGGPFLYILGGDLQAANSGEDATFNLKQRSMIGGYAGLGFDLSQTTSWYGEMHVLGDGWLFGTGIDWKF